MTGKDSVRPRLARNAAAMVLQVVLSALVLVATYWLLMNRLTMEEIGLWSLVVGSVLVTRLSEMGLGAGVLRFVAADTAAGQAGRAAGSRVRLICLPGCRGVAQPGRALGSGPRGRWFESTRPDQLSLTLANAA